MGRERWAALVNVLTLMIFAGAAVGFGLTAAFLAPSYDVAFAIALGMTGAMTAGAIWAARDIYTELTKEMP